MSALPTPPQRRNPLNRVEYYEQPSEPSDHVMIDGEFDDLVATEANFQPFKSSY